MQIARLAVASAAVAIVAIACGSESKEPATTAKGNPPTVSFTALRAYDGFSGEVEVELAAAAEAGLNKVQLLLDGERVVAGTAGGASLTRTLTWDGSQVADGIHELQLVVIDASGQQGESAKVPVVFYNGGTRKVLAPEEGAVQIPADYSSGELDLKHHWQNPAGIGRIIGFIAWDTAGQTKPWNLEFSVGSGECPDNGEVLSERVTGTEGAIVAVATPTGDKVRTGLHFAHVRPMNAAEHKGESLPYRVGVYVFPK